MAATSYPTIKKYVPPVQKNADGTTLSTMGSSNPYEYNPGNSAEGGGGTVQPQSYAGGQVQQRSALSSLPENLANTYQNTLAGMMSGAAYSPYRTTQFAGMNKAAQQLRSNAQVANVGRAGQGTAIANKSGVEASIASMAGNTALQAATDEQAMKERGLGVANTLAGMNENVRATDINQGMATDTAYGYTDPRTGQFVRGSNILEGVKTDIAQQQADTTKELGYAQLSSNEKVAFAGMDIDKQKIAETARQFNIGTDQAESQFARNLQKDYSQLSQADKQFMAAFGLDEAKFNESKIQFSQNLALETEKVAQNERIATATLNLDKDKLAETARQFNVGTAEAARMFTDKLKFDYDSLSQNDKQFLTTLGFNREQFEQSKLEFDKNYSLQDKLQTRDLDIKEKALAQEGSQFNSRLNFDKWATQKGLDDAAANRIWQATQNDKSIAATKEIQTMLNNTDVWKTNQAAKLTKLGWTKEAAQAALGRQQEIVMFGMQSALTKEIESGKITQQIADRAQQASQFTSQLEWQKEATRLGITESEAQRAWATNERVATNAYQSIESSYERQMQKEIASGSWTDANGNQVSSLQAKQLLETVRQYDNEDAWRAKAKAMDLSEADTQRAWASNERIESNIQALNMQQISNVFTEKGWNFQAVYNAIESLPPELAAAQLQTMAAKSGIEYATKNPDGSIATDADGNVITAPGFENISQQAYTESKNNVSAIVKNPTGYLAKNKIPADISSKIATGWDTYVKENPDTFVPTSSLEGFSTVHYVTKGGLNRWKLSDEAKTFVQENAGKLYKAENGKIYQVVGTSTSEKRNSTASIVLKDVVTGMNVRYSSGPGGSAKYNFVV